MQVCELLQLVTDAAIERCFEKLSVHGILQHNK